MLYFYRFRNIPGKDLKDNDNARPSDVDTEDRWIYYCANDEVYDDIHPLPVGECFTDLLCYDPEFKELQYLGIVNLDGEGAPLHYLRLFMDDAYGDSVAYHRGVQKSLERRFIYLLSQALGDPDPLWTDHPGEIVEELV